MSKQQYINYDDTFETDRLILRFYKHSDYKEWKRAFSSLNPAKNRYDMGPFSEDRLTNKSFQDLVLKYKDRIENEDMFYFAVYEKTTNQQVGILFLSDIIRKIYQNTFIGYHVFNNYWRHGYATEMINKALDIVFNTLNLHRVESCIGLGNKPSIQLADKLGFRCEGVCKKRMNFGGTWTDTLTYAMTVEDHKNSQ